MPSLENRLESTLERLRNFEKRSVSRALASVTPKDSLEKKPRESSDKKSGISGGEAPKTSLSFAQILKERYGIDSGRKSAPKPHIDQPPRVFAEQEHPVQKRQFQSEDKPRGSDLSTLKNILSNIKAGKSVPAEVMTSRTEQVSQPIETKKTPYEPRSPMPWFETKKSLVEAERPESRGQMVIENEPWEDNRIEEEEQNTQAAPIQRDMSFSYRPKSVDKGSRSFESSGFGSTYKSMVQAQDRPRTQAQPQDSPSYNKFAQYPSYQQQEQRTEYRRSSTSPAPREFSRTEHVQSSPKFPKYTESQQSTDRGRGPTQSQGKEFRSSQSMETENIKQSQGKSSAGKSIAKELPKKSPAMSDNSRDSLINQWIDQKVNGFLIFQNTLKDQTTEHIEDFARYCSDKWFHLSKAERDEYTVSALGVRSALKQELKELALTTSDMSQLQQILDERIKLVKK